MGPNSERCSGGETKGRMCSATLMLEKAEKKKGRDNEDERGRENRTQIRRGGRRQKEATEEEA